MAPRAAPTGRQSLRQRLRGLPLLAALAAAFHEAGIDGVAAATIVTLAVPVTATAFVYEIGALRGAQLEHEASHRGRLEGTLASRPLPDRGGAVSPLAPQQADVAAKLDTMLASRSALIDTFGDDAAAVAPVYGRIIKQMLKDDEATFALLQSRRADDALPPAAVREREASLRTAHARLARLVEP